MSNPITPGTGQDIFNPVNPEERLNDPQLQHGEDAVIHEEQHDDPVVISEDQIMGRYALIVAGLKATTVKKLEQEELDDFTNIMMIDEDL